MLRKLIPEIYYFNKDDLVIVKKAIVSIILPDRNTNFQLPSDYSIFKYAESKGLEITKNLLKDLNHETMKEGYMTIILLSFKEFLLYIIAHELRYHWQHVIPIRIGTGTLCSKLEKEKDADT